SMDRLAINKAVLCPVRPMDYAYPPQNEFVAQTVDRHRDRFEGLGRVDPRRPDCEEESERCLSDPGLRGLYLHPWEDAFCVADPIEAPDINLCDADRAAG